jgi:hypothetical protein
MNSSSNAVGLFVRQKINTFFNKNFWIIVILVALILAAVVSTSGQQGESKEPPLKTVNEPKVDIKVNRHYDAAGNVIGYDSIYSSYYSSAQGDTVGMHNLMKKFNQHFNTGHPWHFDKYFDKAFFSDTTEITDFFGDGFFQRDYFRRQYKFNDNFFNDMMQELDSIKNKFHHRSRGAPKKR